MSDILLYLQEMLKRAEIVIPNRVQLSEIIQSDWDGIPSILITSENSEFEGHQFDRAAISRRNVRISYVSGEDRNIVWEKTVQTIEKAIEILKKHSRVLSVTLILRNVNNVTFDGVATDKFCGFGDIRIYESERAVV